MIYGSVCSGIEAASVAWEPLGWAPAWLSEIEPFPSAVLAHHWPHVTNLGDMTKIATAVLKGDVAAPDILVGGTPCQAFSVAGALDTAQGIAVAAPAIALQTDVTPKASEELAFTLKLPSSSGGGQPAAAMTPDMAVRRLTPVECERLQGFPDGHTDVPYRGKAAADGPRYKAIGNSMAVPCMAWIGQRIKLHLEAL